MTGISPRRSGVSTLVDTGAWYALADTADRHHREARRFYASHAGPEAFVTTDLIVAETRGLIHAHLGRAAALAFWGGLRDAQIRILTVDGGNLEVAWHIVRAYSDHAFSFLDCTTFAVMGRLGITEAFAFDARFLVCRYGPGQRRTFHRVP